MITLYYSGIIKPIQVYIVNNINARGYIAAKYFEYGRSVQKGQTLFSITSKQLASDYQAALTSYIKAKKNYGDASYRMEGEEELNKLKMISQEEYLTSKTQLFNARLDYEQAKEKLYDLLESIGVSKDTLVQIESSNEAIYTALKNAPKTIKIISPNVGIALYPESSTEKQTTLEPLEIGALVKEEQPLVLINDKTGISVTVNVSELDILNINYDQKALIKSDAFPGVTLKGTVVHIDREADADSVTTGLPTFKVKIVVPKLTPKESAVIRIGMSCEVTIPITKPPVIKIPLAAVYKKQGQSLVKVINPTTKEAKEIMVETGTTYPDAVEVVKGLKGGEEILVDASPH